jgi:hypothetical protein
MRAIVSASVIVIALSAAHAQAADASIATAPNATPAWQWAGYYNDDSYSRACPYGYYYSCRYDDPYYGERGHCACWPYLPYWLYH